MSSSPSSAVEAADKYFEKPSVFAGNPFSRLSLSSSSSTYNKVATNEEDEVMKRLRCARRTL
jgi:hypothetical protein